MSDFTLLAWLLALTAAALIGVSKAGIKGLSVLFVTMMAFAFGGKASTGIVLPLLIAGDVFAVIYYNRHARWKYIVRLMPWMVAGVLVGVWVGKDVPEALFKKGMAFIILGSVVMMYWWDRKKVKRVPTQWWFAGAMGFLAGFTTMVGNLAGAVTNIFFLAMRLPKDEFIGTAAWLFFIINIFKLPFHIFVWGTISMDTFPVNIRLLPGVVVGIVLGIWMVKFIRDQQYRRLILLLTGIGAVLMFFR